MIKNELMASILGPAVGENYAQGHLRRMPEDAPCAIYFDDIEVTTADRVTLKHPHGGRYKLPRIYTHNFTIELYEPVPNLGCEVFIEGALDEKGITWTKQDRYWLKDAQRYQVVYEFSCTEKSQ